MGRLLAGLGLWWRSLGDGKVLPRGVLGCPAFMGRSTGLGPSGIGAAAVAAVPWVALMGKALPEGLGHPAEHGPQQPHHHALLHARTHIFIEHLNIYLHAQKFLKRNIQLQFHLRPQESGFMWLLGSSKVRVSATGMGKSPAKRCPSPKPINGTDRCTHQPSSHSSVNIGPVLMAARTHGDTAPQN